MSLFWIVIKIIVANVKFLVLYFLCFWPLREAILSCYKTSKVQWTVSDGHGSVLTLMKLISGDWKWYCLRFFFGDTKTSSVWVPGSQKRMDGFPLIFGSSKRYLYGIICILFLIYLKMEECRRMKCTHFQSMIWSQEQGVMKPAA